MEVTIAGGRLELRRQRTPFAPRRSPRSDRLSGRHQAGDVILKGRYPTCILPFALLVLASCVTGASSPASAAADRERLLQLHAEVMRAHRESNVDIILENEPQDYVVADRGEISHPTIEQRRAHLGRYLAATRFTEYVDSVPPIVAVSRDGTSGWVIVQVRARGEQTDEAGARKPLAFESAWIELYEKRQDRWFRVGNVSNFKP